MRFIDVLRISFQMLRTNLLRSLLTVAAIGMAISLIVVLVGVGYGIQDITIGSIVHSQSLLSLDVSPGPDGKPALNDAALQAFKNYPGVQGISPVLKSADGQVLLNGTLVTVGLESGKANLQNMEGKKLLKGREFVDGAAEAIISDQAVALLNSTPDQIIGQKVTLAFVNPDTQQRQAIPGQVTIVGVSVDDALPPLFIPYDMIQNLPDVQMTGAKILGADPNSVASIQSTLIGQGYAVDSLIDTLDQAQTVFHWVTIALVVIALIALIVAAIGMFNTLTIALLERTREIGIMKSLGITDRTILKLFLTEAAGIGFMGGLAGIGVGLLISVIINQVVAQLAVHYGGVALQIFQWPNYFLLTMLLYPIILSILTGLYPALRAAKLNPLTALRYE